MNKKQFKAFTRHIINVYNEHLVDGINDCFITEEIFRELVDKAYKEYQKLPTETVEV